jgi:tight adherence protein C
VAQQLPGAAELLAFSVAAGESIIPALARVGRATGGELGLALRDCVADVRTGETLDAALRRVATSTGSPEVERFVDRITISLERGTPLSDVLRAQAADARAHQRNMLIEIAGRKDVAMLIPVVFLILPTVVLIALFPGLRALTQIAG